MENSLNIMVTHVTSELSLRTQTASAPLDEMNQPARRPKALFILDSDSLDVIYGPEERRDLEQVADFFAPPQTPESVHAHPELLADVEVIFSGWGAPKLDEEFLSAASNLRAIFYGAGSIRYFTTDAF